MRFAMSALSATRMAAGLLLSALVSGTFAARAEDVEYSKIGWWSISYTKLDDLSYCRAMAPFDQGTVLEMALFQKGGQGWVVSISNPTWKAWMVKKRRHDLRLETTLPPDPRSRLPPDLIPLGPSRVVTFSLSNDKTSLVVGVPIDLINDIADARSLEIFDENRTRRLTSLDMKHSAAAINAVRECVREPPAQTVSRYGGSLNPIAAVRRFKDLFVGERVYTIGNPSGLTKTLGEGLISGLREPPNDIRYVQTTAPISEGSSDGALVDSKGALVGITTFRLKDAQSLNFAIAAEDYWH